MKVALFHGRGVISALIRWQTRAARYSHAAIVDDDGTVYEAWQGAGVRRLPALAPGDGVTLFEIDGIREVQKARVRQYWINHIANGTRYDYVGVLRFVTRRRKGDDSKLFCSEAVFNSLKAANIELFARTEGWEVSPDLLSRAPLLREAGGKVS